MKRIVLIFLAIGLTLAAVAQDSKETKKERKQRERKEAAAAMNKFLNGKEFVLEANNLYDRYGQIYQVQSNLNFIMVDGDQAILQLGSNNTIGSNGVGGVTIDGKVTKYDLKANKKRGTFSLTMHIASSAGNYDVRLTTGPSGNAQATVSSSFSGRIRYSGDLMPLYASNAYVGNSIF